MLNSNLMKKTIDILLVIVFLGAVAYVVATGLGGVISAVGPTPTNSAVPTFAPSQTSIPTDTLTPTLIPASVTIPTKTSTPTQELTSTPTSSPTPTSTETPTPSTTPTITQTSTADPTQSSLGVEIANGIDQGNQIVKAIEAYHNAQGIYPLTLDDLVPTYLDKLPKTLTGQDFYYRLFDNGGPLASEVYWLAFKAVRQEHVTCTYLRRLDYWDCNYDSP